MQIRTNLFPVLVVLETYIQDHGEPEGRPKEYKIQEPLTSIQGRWLLLGSEANFRNLRALE